MAQTAEKPIGIKITENGAVPTYPADQGILKALIRRSLGEDVEYIAPTDPEEIAKIRQEVHRLSSSGVPFPTEVRREIRRLGKKK